VAPDDGFWVQGPSVYGRNLEHLRGVPMFLPRQEDPYGNARCGTSIAEGEQRSRCCCSLPGNMPGKLEAHESEQAF